MNPVQWWRVFIRRKPVSPREAAVRGLAHYIATSPDFTFSANYEAFVTRRPLWRSPPPEGGCVRCGRLAKAMEWVRANWVVQGIGRD